MQKLLNDKFNLKNKIFFYKYKVYFFLIAGIINADHYIYDEEVSKLNEKGSDRIFFEPC